eukprot:5821947-Alexandrium_andersonii.AAC.1
MFCAMLTRPATAMCYECGSVPRLLADDMLISAQGDQASECMDESIAQVKGFYDGMGMRVQVNKNVIMSTCKSRRQRLRVRAKMNKGLGFECRNSIRDLGARIVLGEGRG